MLSSLKSTHNQVLQVKSAPYQNNALFHYAIGVFKFIYKTIITKLLNHPQVRLTKYTNKLIIVLSNIYKRQNNIKNIQARFIFRENSHFQFRYKELINDYFDKIVKEIKQQQNGLQQIQKELEAKELILRQALNQQYKQSSIKYIVMNSSLDNRIRTDQILSVTKIFKSNHITTVQVSPSSLDQFLNQYIQIYRKKNTKEKKPPYRKFIFNKNNIPRKDVIQSVIQQNQFKSQQKKITSKSTQKIKRKLLFSQPHNKHNTNSYKNQHSQFKKQTQPIYTPRSSINQTIPQPQPQTILLNHNYQLQPSQILIKPIQQNIPIVQTQYLYDNRVQQPIRYQSPIYMRMEQDNMNRIKQFPNGTQRPCSCHSHNSFKNYQTFSNKAAIYPNKNIISGQIKQIPLLKLNSMY